jgi:hypothetical protein
MLKLNLATVVEVREGKFRKYQPGPFFDLQYISGEFL